MPKIKFPSGIFTKQHFGSEKGQIKVSKTLDGRVGITLGKQTYTVSEDFYLKRLEVASGFSDTKKYFKGFYWGTEEGRQQRDEQLKMNYRSAINAKFPNTPPSLRQYAIDLFENLNIETRNYFAENNNNFESVFEYERYDWNPDHDPYQMSDEQISELFRLIKDLEGYYQNTAYLQYMQKEARAMTALRRYKRLR